ncbi:MAG TPA: DEAD/DEAH box helicase family protein [Blastocatellia bacterium]|jgi:type III restriction enzyme|nr:DEAD/DEAH box helicase family protein [Blastocatellia bacterium]
MTLARRARNRIERASYYELFGDALKATIQRYHAMRAEAPGPEASIFELVESGVTRHRLRYYQTEALYLLDYLLGLSPERQEKKLLIEKIDEEKDISAPFLGFEMATGSGKTMLMGASMFYISRKFGVKNFLVITPASTDIYRKTVLNFKRGGAESVWAPGAPFTHNLITGDDYTAAPLYGGFNPGRDISIFVFNISKFGANAVYTRKEWEKSVWRDERGDTISIRDYLQREKLVIITDEAHHAQNPASNRIIKSFHPEAVLEFTATAVEGSQGEARKAQTIVYKYDIRRFLEDGYGKTVRAVALNVDDRGVRADRLTGLARGEKVKLITLVLIHLLKKRAVLRDEGARGLKPIAFVKVKDETTFAERVFDYVRRELHRDEDDLGIVLNKLSAEPFEITGLLRRMFDEDFGGDPRKLALEVERVTRSAIFYHGKSDKETRKRWSNIRRNEVEIVVYMQKLDEGIDMPNIYSMAVINDNLTDFKTAVKQIIGRGVRLGKEKREFDESDDELLAQSEKLHVVCDHGAAFEDVILAVQKELGLPGKHFSVEREREAPGRRPPSDLSKGLSLRAGAAGFNARPLKSASGLMEIARDAESVVGAYVERDCFPGYSEPEGREGKGNLHAVFLKFTPGSFFAEADILADEKLFHRQLRPRFSDAALEVGGSHAGSIYAILMKTLFCLPDKRESREIIGKYLERIEEIGVRFYFSDEADRVLAHSRFVGSFASFYRGYIEKNCFRHLLNHQGQRG